MSPRPFRPWQPEQGQLLPQYTREALGEGNLACFFADLAGVLDFSPVLKGYTKECGQPPYHPVMMTLLLMYAYARGVNSSREIERRCEIDLGFRYLAGGERPDHDTLCHFRVRHLEAFGELFVDTLRVASEAGMKKLGHLAVDGTKVKANASKHKAMSYGRMEEATRKLEEQVKKLLEEAAALDAQEDERYGKGRRGDELPEEMKDPATRAERLKEAKRRLEADKKRALAAEKKKRVKKIRRAQQDLEQEARHKAEQKGQKPEEAKPESKAQRNFTDPDSRIMKRDGSFQQSYNAQVAVDAETQLIVAQEVGQSPSDARQLEPMVAQVEANTGLLPKELSADSGYFCREDIEQVQQRGVEPFVAPGRSKHGQEPVPAPRGRPPKALSFKERMGRKLQTKRGRRAYARRKVTAEPVIGQVKNTVLKGFSLRGLRKVRGEFSLACAVHNLKKLWKQTWELPSRAALAS
ncbi:IS1182 family transposase [Stigmatella sp. ncwal1]|uniref:IS1182 family transposase n=1 Tax=Stigmatella ashevillensis TaxID=2995309 RepID=A0ABT5DM91_9BACT|nr:IS1182 family transposase [Stigmatella ashevillena]MDC0708841.1 IS1182 family transposase [Stigmatella ashevillena]MDC0714642.1 IS1182 family transposase [Stigmatella ashevillena]MDC0714780.1 IS1182 family transposase [Stigmatella ashevillena]